MISDDVDNTLRLWDADPESLAKKACSIVNRTTTSPNGNASSVMPCPTRKPARIYLPLAKRAG